MKRPRDRRDWLQHAVALSVRRPRLVLACWVLAALVASVGVLKLEVDTATSSFLDRANPKWNFYQSSLSQFGGDEFILVAVEGDEPFDAAALDLVRELSLDFEGVDGVRRVESIATFPSVVAGSESSLRIAPAIQEAMHSEDAARRVAEIVRGDWFASKFLVSKDERTFAINIRLTDDVDADRSPTIDTVNEIIANRGAWYSGVPVFRTEVNKQARGELAVYVPVTVVVVFGVMLIAFRSVLAALVTLGSAGVGTWIVLGAMGAMGASISLSTMILPSIMLALGCAYVAHVLAAARGASDREGLEEAVVRVSRPIGFSGLTTAIGFLAMATVPIGAIRALGTFGSLGSIVVLGAALTFAPAILRLRPLGPGEERLDFWISSGLLRKLIGWVRHRGRGVFLIWLTLGVSCSLGIRLLDVDTDIIRWFSHETKTRQSYEAIRSRLSGITAINVVIEGESGRVVTDPGALRAVDELSAYVAALPEVGAAVSVADVVRQIHAEIGVKLESPLPESRALVEQYLGVLGAVDYLRDLISDDRQIANILIRANANGSSQILGLAEKIEDWWRRNGPADYRIGVTGIMYEFGRAEDAIAYGQLRGLGLALAAIGLILLALFRSMRNVLAALVPNVLPIVVVYGVMGFLNIALDAATVCVGSIALGIAVDDTIHVAMGWRTRLTTGVLPERALEDTLGRVLFPLVVTTVAVASGFLVLGVSDFTLIRHFGVVTGSVVVLCLLADLTLLPVLLGWARSDS